MTTTTSITPFLWFDTQAEKAAEQYVKIFSERPGASGVSKILGVTRYGEAGPGTPGSAMTVEFMLDGLKVVGLNGGPHHTFNEAISFQIGCETQDEVDELWNALSDGGEPGPCGWLTDRFGLSWQVIPNALPELLSDPDQEKSQRVMRAMLQMGKIDIAELRRAADAA